MLLSILMFFSCSLAALSGFAFDDTDPAIHDLPDGTVKIAMQVTVKFNVTSVQYDVGFNPETLKMILKEMKQETTDDYAKNMATFKGHFEEKLPELITLKINDHSIKPDAEIKVSKDELKKHVQASFTMQFVNEGEGDWNMEVLDKSFAGLARIYNTGFKTKGNRVAVTDSSTETIPIRSKTEEVAASKETGFKILGVVKRLTKDQAGSSNAMVPLVVVFGLLGASAVVGLLFVPLDIEPDTGHHDHH